MTMITISDIAKKAGVAKSTVSRYLNGGCVSQETRKKIDKVVKETGYVPNPFARSLKAKRTYMIGVIIPRLNSPSTNKVLTGMDTTCREKGYQWIITNSNQDQNREIENLYTLAKQKVDGIILLPKKISSKHEKAFEEISTPILVLGQRSKNIPSIIYSDYKAGKTIGEYALKLGHRSFLYVSVSEEDIAVGKERKKGFLDAVKKFPETKIKIITTDFQMDAAYKTALKTLSHLKASFIACATDTIALAFLKAAHQLNIPIPEFISLTGFGGYDTLSFVSPSITTIAYPYYEVGKLAVQQLDRIIQGFKVPNLVEMPHQLIIKESTKSIL